MIKKELKLVIRKGLNDYEKVNETITIKDYLSNIKENYMVLDEDGIVIKDFKSSDQEFIEEEYKLEIFEFFDITNIEKYLLSKKSKYSITRESNKEKVVDYFEDEDLKKYFDGEYTIEELSISGCYKVYSNKSKSIDKLTKEKVNTLYLNLILKKLELGRISNWIMDSVEYRKSKKGDFLIIRVNELMNDSKKSKEYFNNR